MNEIINAGDTQIEKHEHYRKNLNIKTELHAQHYWSLGKCKLNPQWDITAYLLEWLKLKTKSKCPSDGEGTQHLPLSHTAGGNAKWNATVENSLSVSCKLIYLPYEPATPSHPYLEIYPREIKTYIHIKTCRWLFITALFIMALSRELLKCPSAGNWINKLWYIHRMESNTTQQHNATSWWYCSVKEAT